MSKHVAFSEPSSGGGHEFGEDVFDEPPPSLLAPRRAPPSLLEPPFSNQFSSHHRLASEPAAASPESVVKTRRKRPRVLVAASEDGGEVEERSEAQVEENAASQDEKVEERSEEDEAIVEVPAADFDVTPEMQRAMNDELKTMFQHVHLDASASKSAKSTKTAVPRKRARRSEPDADSAAAAVDDDGLPPPKGALTGEAHMIADLSMNAMADVYSKVGATRTELRPLNAFPTEFKTNRSHHNCELCRVGDSGRTMHSGVLADVYAIFNTNIGAVPIGKIYEMITSTYNNYVRALNASTRLAEYGQEPYKEWTIEMVQTHYDAHEVNLLKILYDLAIAVSDKMGFTNSQMTYYVQERGGEQVLRSDIHQEKLYLTQGKFLRDTIKDIVMLKHAILTQTGSLGMVSNSSGANGNGGQSSAMSRLTQRGATRGATGFNNR